MVKIMNSTHNSHFLLGLSISGAEDARYIVSSGGKNSKENFTNEKGGRL